MLSKSLIPSTMNLQKLPSKIKNFYIKPYYIDENIVIQQKANTENSKKLNYKKILDQLYMRRAL